MNVLARKLQKSQSLAKKPTTFRFQTKKLSFSAKKALQTKSISKCSVTKKINNIQAKRAFGLGRHDGGFYGNTDVNPDMKQFNPKNPGVYEWRTHTFEYIDGRSSYREMVRSAPMYYHRHYSQLYPRPLTEPMDGVPAQASASSAPKVQTSTTSRGIKAVTVTSDSPQTSFGLFIDAGSRYENHSTSGASYMLKSLGFESTVVRPGIRFLREMEMHGMDYQVSAGRDQMAYTLSNANPALNPLSVELLLDSSRPLLNFSEIADKQVQVANQVSQILSQDYLADKLHQVAFRTGLGNALVAPWNVSNLGPDVLRSFMAPLYQPSRYTCVAVGGISHEAFVEQLESHKNNHVGCPEIMAYAYESALEDFMRLSSGQPDRKQVLKEIQNTPQRVATQYFGGEFAQPTSGAAQIAIGFQGVAVNDKDAPAVSVLQSILGGGVHSASGKRVPGYLTSRINKNLVERDLASEASVFNLNYSDAGLFGVQAIARSNIGDTASGIVQTLKGLASLDETEVARGKRVAQNEILKALETTQGQLEWYGSRSSSPVDYISAIQKLTAKDITSVASRILSSRPSVVALGNLTKLPTQEQIAQQLK